MWILVGSYDCWKVASMDLLVFLVDEKRLAIDLAVVERVVSAAALSSIFGTPPVVLGLLNLHGNPVPVISMRIKLGLPPREMLPSDEIIIVRRRGCLLGLAVDDTEGVASDAEVFPFDSATETKSMVAAAKLDDGIVLVQNVNDDSFCGEEERAFLADTGGSRR